MSLQLLARYGLTKAASGGGVTEYGITALPDPVTGGTSTNLQIGWEFTVGAADITVTALRIWNYQSNGGYLRVWRVSDQQLLIGPQVANPVINTWTEASVTPVVLSSGSNYVVTWLGSRISFDDTSKFTFNGALTYVQTRYLASTAFPTTTETAKVYGIPDIVFTT